ncbi:MAG: ARP2/3 complex 21 kDa subunit [Amphiamblys sp. WSBS2006]|nr:MAG: ARP2/3 complex 21 kDa subunit [Amphiamblys sp. WSBS2006]
MPPYSSAFNGTAMEKIDGFPVPPSAALVEEALRLFKPNSFYPSFEMRGDGDIVLVYLHSFIQECLKALDGTMGRRAAEEALAPKAAEALRAGSEGLHSVCKKGEVTGELRKHLYGLRVLAVEELLKRVYRDSDTPDKWWLVFQKRKCAMGLSL